MMSEVKPSHIEHMIAFAELRGSLAGDAARAELAQLRAELAQAQARIAELTAERERNNQYLQEIFILRSDFMTAKETIAQLGSALRTASLDDCDQKATIAQLRAENETLRNRDMMDRAVMTEASAKIEELRADFEKIQARIAELTAERDAARAELASNKVYQRMAARR